ncbi:GGDEF domain-containing protein [Marinobacter zhejiangensis]|uniref:diguanylate cyclase n=1 Tax=Marinobacter zhejiangensis TaxID=488535 RepID=A0A1I4PBA5_9GAMM|nr:GGDEF domain-containing protein [Marinobacter zhejiangensis]SFM24999.1 diguanylate cyclase (GGDEF) domain-containing protein [Marinobacter zhejiangensis]
MSRKHTPGIAKIGEDPNQLANIRQATAEWQNNTNPFATLACRLATTLVLEEQIALFTETLQVLVPFDQLTYRHQIGKQEMILRHGMGGPHRCEYRLTLQGESYGAMTISRRQRFAEEELTAIEQMLAVAISHIRNACQYAAIEQTALTDALTAIPNKRALDEALTKACSIAERHCEDYTLILCDLDHFKQVNDNHGHIIGDHLLRACAKAIELAVRNSDALFRFGGEEFAVVLPHTSERDAQIVAERIRERVAEIKVNCGESDLAVTISAGIATRQRAETPEQWTARADEALYRAKKAGRNRTRIANRIG